MVAFIDVVSGRALPNSQNEADYVLLQKLLAHSQKPGGIYNRHDLLNLVFTAWNAYVEGIEFDKPSKMRIRSNGAIPEPS